MDINNDSGWLFPDSEKNEVHYLTGTEVEQLFELAEADDSWAANIKEYVRAYDEHPGGNFFVNWVSFMNSPGTVVRYPFDLAAITFPSRRHLFRGESRIYESSIPSLNRKLQGMAADDKKMWEALATLRIRQFYKFIWKIDVVPYWEAKLSDINILALAQHYGFCTHLLDLTNDVRVALFFATCQYVSDTGSYRPLTAKECGEREYGVLFHTPDWMIDYSQTGLNLKQQDKLAQGRLLSINAGDFDEMAFQIGMQPLMRCHYQSGYMYPMVVDRPLQDNWQFEKLYIKLTPELSRKIFDMMDGGRKVFPNEGISEARSVLNKIKKSYTFSEDDLLFLNEDIRERVRGYEFAGNKLTIQPNEVEYDLPKEVWDAINAKYNDKDILEPIGGMPHIQPEEQKIRDARCIEIYGKLIE